MSIFEIALGIVLIILSVMLTLVVLFQEGHQKANDPFSGSSNDTFLTKHKSRSIDAFLERWTRAIAISFFMVALLTNVILYFHLFGA